MTEPGASEISQQIASLRQLGADKFDPVRFHHLEVLARRASTHPGRVQHLLTDKLAQALETLKARFNQARADTQRALEQLAPQHPQAAAELQELLHRGDLAAAKRGLLTLDQRAPGSPLAALTRQLLQQQRR